MRIFILELLFVAFSRNKEIGVKCCPVFEPLQILKIMQFVCEICNKENVEVVNSLMMYNPWEYLLWNYSSSPSQ